MGATAVVDRAQVDLVTRLSFQLEIVRAQALDAPVFQTDADVGTPTVGHAAGVEVDLRALSLAGLETLPARTHGFSASVLANLIATPVTFGARIDRETRSCVWNVTIVARTRNGAVFEFAHVGTVSVVVLARVDFQAGGALRLVPIQTRTTNFTS